LALALALALAFDFGLILFCARKSKYEPERGSTVKVGPIYWFGPLRAIGQRPHEMQRPAFRPSAVFRKEKEVELNC